MKHTIIILMFFLFINIPVQSEYRMNFYLGEISVEVNGEKIHNETGMTIPPNAVIITGNNAFAHIFDTQNNNVITIKQNSRVNMDSLLSSRDVKKQKSMIDKFGKEFYNKKTIMAAVRANEEGQSEIEWSEDSKANNNTSDNLSAVWKLYDEQKYEMVLSETKGARDPEGKFLHGASLYRNKGMQNPEEIIRELDSVLGSTTGTELKMKTNLILASIYFETGRYDLSLKHINAAVKYQPEDEISETSYYILIMSNINTGKESDAKTYIPKMKKYHAKSSLLGEFEK